MPRRVSLKCHLLSLAAMLIAAASVSQLVNAQSSEAKPVTVDEIAASAAASSVLITGVDPSECLSRRQDSF
jgi:hypothetical protein